MFALLFPKPSLTLMKKDPEIATSRKVTSIAYNLIFMEPICFVNVFMRKQIIIYLALVLSTISCDDKYDRNLKDFLGEWQLKEMSYTNESGENVVLEDISSSIIFSDENISNSDGNIDKKGILIVGSDSIDFVYQFDFSQDMINIEIERTKMENRPLYTFGKMQVNNFEFSDKKSLIFSNAFEIVYPTKEKLTNPVYVFER
jgi:hypothetical protein